MLNGVFSDYEVNKMSLKFADEQGQAMPMDCVGSVEEEMTAKVITKKCRGVVIKNIVKGTGEGVLNISVHMPYDVYKKGFGMENDDLKEGVIGYGSKSVHPEFCLAEHILDEDGVEKYKAYPKCVFAKKSVVTTENGAEEVAEIEGEITVSPDEFGYGVYEALADDLDEPTKTAWMTNFTSELVQVASA